MHEYCKLTFQTSAGTRRTVWAKKHGAMVYERVNKYGERFNKRELILVVPSDIISYRVAIISEKYATLEIASYERKSNDSL